ncbi:hypothetical protein [Hymenobacter metallilatus]|uniref:DUF2335 domain-containing protein n=1 Tax=Hymenobacter metallilatus TaxID=2493666 RepID=A0A428IYE0_9BACT|nr:hypothetical protein [Hymenobacter metallilatus]RSK24167.1 hypothetical protein EI290_20510 [Hymenobacter metallilatus]
MYREKYAQKQAIHLYTIGQSCQQVQEMLLLEGAAPEQAAPLALKYQKLQRLLATEDARKQLKTAGMLRTIGSVFAGGGIMLSLLSLVYLTNHVVLYYGLIGLGVGLIIKSALDKKAAEKMLQQLK